MPREKTPMGAAARGNPWDDPVIARWGPSFLAWPGEQSRVLSPNWRGGSPPRYVGIWDTLLCHSLVYTLCANLLIKYIPFISPVELLSSSVPRAMSYSFFVSSLSKHSKNLINNCWYWRCMKSFNVGWWSPNSANVLCICMCMERSHHLYRKPCYFS